MLIVSNLALHDLDKIIYGLALDVDLGTVDEEISICVEMAQLYRRNKRTPALSRSRYLFWLNRSPNPS